MSDVNKEIDDIQKDIYSSVNNESWFKYGWRPAMAWAYFAIILFDFLIAPILLGWFAGVTGSKLLLWQTLTTQGGGIFHMSMGAIIGVTAWSRGQEKIYGVHTGATRMFESDEERSDYINEKRRRLEELKKKKSAEIN